ncbi:MAG TPA: amidohydrolase [Acidimicrobiia bacterium]
MDTTDLIITGARIWDQTDRGEEALAVADGRILVIGSNRDVLSAAGAETEIIDVDGRRLIPGLIDSHLHLVRAGRTWDREVRWDDMTSLDEAVTALEDKAEAVGPGRWVGVMGGWHPNQFTEGTGPSRRLLDDALPNNPVFIQRAYAETFLNARAMEEMGWVERHGGVVTSPPDMAALRAQLAVADIEEAKSGTKSLLRELNRLGLTGAIDASGFGITSESYDAFLQLFEQGERGFRARFLLGAANPGSELDDIEQWTETISLGGDNGFIGHLGAGEVLDYAAHDMEGLQPKDVTSRVDALREMSAHLADRGWPVHLHSILDTSIGVVLDAWEALDASKLTSLRWAICHADQIGTENLKRVADLGVGITIQNGMSMRGLDCAPTWGTDLVTHAPPVKTILALGIPVAAGTDGTVACAYNPWRCIAWLVTGESIDGAPPRVESERLTRDDALRLYTSAGAWFSFEEDTRGTLRPGAHADFAVLSADPLRVGEDEIADIESVLTVVGGERVHQ